jgi:2,3-bisphosphoglycerate-independent phosphoglycerate mutase
MKYAIILPDGASDDPIEALGGRTPLEAARTPNMDWIAEHGKQGMAVTVPEGFIPATDVATMSLFGYDPHDHYTGRAPIEAAARKLKAADDELIFRCNFITVEDGRLADFTADHISQPEADRLIADLNALFADDPCAFHAGVSYRNLMLAGGASDLELKCTPPHDIPGEEIAAHMPEGKGAERVIAMMERAEQMLADHPVNAERIANGKKPATNIWLWGQGRPTVLEPFDKVRGVKGAVITGVDIIRGLAVCMGMDLIEVEGATGYLDTNYKGKGEAGVKALEDYDLVVVHVEAPDEAGHEGDADEKVTAIERTDELLVGPMLEAVRRHPEWRIMVAPDHPTKCATKAHSIDPPPVCFAGTGIDGESGKGFTEAFARGTGLVIDPATGVMDAFMGQGG